MFGYWCCSCIQARRPKELAVAPSNGAALVATEADKQVAIDEVLERAGLSSEVMDKLKAEEIDDLWALKRLLRAENINLQRDLGLGFKAVENLKDAVSGAL